MNRVVVVVAAVSQCVSLILFHSSYLRPSPYASFLHAHTRFIYGLVLVFGSVLIACGRPFTRQFTFLKDFFFLLFNSFVLFSYELITLFFFSAALFYYRSPFLPYDFMLPFSLFFLLNFYPFWRVYAMNPEFQHVLECEMAISKCLHLYTSFAT